MTSTSASPSVSRRIGAAVAVGAVVGIGAFLVTVLFFSAGNVETARIVQFGQVTLWPGIFTLVFSALLALAGLFRRWYQALAAGAISAVLGFLVGTAVFLLVQTGSAANLGAIYSSEGFVILALVLTVSAIVLSLTAGRTLWRSLAGGSADSVQRRIALVRVPSPRLVDGEPTHLERGDADAALAGEQWDEYVGVLSDNGWEIVDVAAAPEHPDSVFVEDAVVVFGDTAVIGSPGAESRRGEIAAVETTVRELGLRVEHIRLPGTLDGGDVLTVGTTVYVGRGGRTNAEGIRQLRALVSPLGYTVVAVPVTRALHLRSSVSALPDGTVIGFAGLVDDPSVFERYLPVPEAAGVAVVVLADDTVLMAASAPRSAALVTDLGYRVLSVDISEFEKLEGGVSGLSVRLR
jgi:dimethylargininase